MHIITRKRLNEFADEHPLAKAGLAHWYRVLKRNKFANLAELRRAFPHADKNRSRSKIDAAASPGYRLRVEGRVATPLTFTLDELRALTAHTAELPIACVEGWSYSARWTGVRLRDLLRMAGAAPEAAVHVESLEEHSPYRVSFLNHFQARDTDTLLATHLDGAVLSADHGYPLRLIGPGRPGVNQTKWVTRVVVV